MISWSRSAALFSYRRVVPPARSSYRPFANDTSPCARAFHQVRLCVCVCVCVCVCARARVGGWGCGVALTIPSSKVRVRHGSEKLVDLGWGSAIQPMLR